MSVIEIESAEGHGPPPHIHAKEEESFYILEGLYEVTIGQTRVSAGPGAFVLVPAGVMHTYQAKGTGRNR